MPSILLTGYPGFLGASLLPRILARRPEATAVCLVQSKFARLAADHRTTLVAQEPSLDGRIDLVEGDITSPTLVERGAGLPKDVDEIYHLAAVYDLSVSAALAWNVNVDGTCHVLDFARKCTSLNRMHYVSTACKTNRWRSESARSAWGSGLRTSPTQETSIKSGTHGYRPRLPANHYMTPIALCTPQLDS